MSIVEVLRVYPDCTRHGGAGDVVLDRRPQVDHPDRFASLQPRSQLLGRQAPGAQESYHSPFSREALGPKNDNGARDEGNGCAPHGAKLEDQDEPHRRVGGRRSSGRPAVEGVFSVGGHDATANICTSESPRCTTSSVSKKVEQTVWPVPTHYNNAVWLATPQRKALSSRRTSLIVDPADGKLPSLTPKAQTRAAARRATAGFHSYENRPLQERCVVWTHEGPPMMPPPYNDVLQIFQTPGYVAVKRELTTNLTRIIATDSRPWVQGGGASRGRWEGDTLVVATANFNGKAAVLGSGASLRVVERFTRVGPDRILYRFTIDDPATWTRPWSAELPMLRTEGPLYEYACHEGNYGMVNTLKGARALDSGVVDGAAAAARR